MLFLLSLIVRALGGLLAGRRPESGAQELEILVLRHQLCVLKRKAGPPKLKPTDRVILSSVSRIFARERWASLMVAPATPLRWHRELVRKKGTYGRAGRPGRPPIDKQTRELILRMARENPRWGAVRIKGELQKLGIFVGERWDYLRVGVEGDGDAGMPKTPDTTFGCTPAAKATDAQVCRRSCSRIRGSFAALTLLAKALVSEAGWNGEPSFSAPYLSYLDRRGCMGMLRGAPVLLVMVGTVLLAAPSQAWASCNWHTVPEGAPPTTALEAVTHLSATDVWAVGADSMGSLTYPFTEHFDGTSWTDVPSAAVHNLRQEPQLLSVSGSASDDVWAVGGRTVSFTNVAWTQHWDGATWTRVVESWNGTTWSIVPSPNRLAKASNVLNGVSCVSVSACTAVGSYSKGTLAESWNGTAWSIVPSPNSGTNEHLYGVSCPSGSSCAAVGSYDNGTVDQTLAESWNGASWSIVPTPNRTTPTSDILNAVTCASETSCTAVGLYTNGTVDQTLVESWDGSAWSIVPSPNKTTATLNELNGVSCVSATSCIAVGDFFGPRGYQTLVESWNGAVWSIVPSPNAGASDNHLNGVSCFSAAGCTAVGSSSNGSIDQTLVESWNGAAWSVVPSPNAGTDGAALSGVSCVAPTSCSAVGYFYALDAYTLAESWDGTAWSIVPSPNSGFDSYLFKVACPSATSCTAVGYLYNTDHAYQTLVESWNGTAWSIVPSPNAAGWSWLYDISCVSETSCAAVGYSLGAQPLDQTLTESWNGTAWSVVPSPNTAASFNLLTGVSCVSDTSCTAVAYADLDYRIERTLIEVSS